MTLTCDTLPALSFAESSTPAGLGSTPPHAQTILRVVVGVLRGCGTRLPTTEEDAHSRLISDHSTSVKRQTEGKVLYENLLVLPPASFRSTDIDGRPSLLAEGPDDSTLRKVVGAPRRRGPVGSPKEPKVGAGPREHRGSGGRPRLDLQGSVDPSAP